MQHSQHRWYFYSKAYNSEKSDCLFEYICIILNKFDVEKTLKMKAEELEKRLSEIGPKTSGNKAALEHIIIGKSRLSYTVWTISEIECKGGQSFLLTWAR